MSGRKLSEVNTVLSRIKQVKEQKSNSLINEARDCLNEVSRMSGLPQDLSNQVRNFNNELNQHQSNISNLLNQLESLENEVSSKPGTEYYTPEYERASSLESQFEAIATGDLATLANRIQALRIDAVNRLVTQQQDRNRSRITNSNGRLSKARFLDEAGEENYTIDQFCNEVLNDTSELDQIYNALDSLQAKNETLDFTNFEAQMEETEGRINRLIPALRDKESAFQGAIDTYWALSDSLESMGVRVDGDWVDPNMKIAGRKLVGETNDIGGSVNVDGYDSVNITMNLDGLAGSSNCLEMTRAVTKSLRQKGVGASVNWVKTGEPEKPNRGRATQSTTLSSRHQSSE